MDFELEYRYALDCELNNSEKNCNNIRNQFLQLVAFRQSLPNASHHERLKDLLHEYSLEIDKKNGVNTFIDSAFEIVQNESQHDEFFVDKWQSRMKKKLDNGVQIRSRIFHKMKEISDKFRQYNEQRMIPLLEDDENGQSIVIPEQDDDDDDDSNLENVNSINIQSSQDFIQQLQPIMAKNSPTRVPGLFRRKSSKTNGFARSLFTRNSTDSQESNKSDQYSEYSCSQESNKSDHIMPIIEESIDNNECVYNNNQSQQPNEESTKKSAFITGLEKHLVDKVVNNDLAKDEAEEIIKNVRKEKLNTFKDPMMKKKSPNNVTNATLLINDERLKGIERGMIELIQSSIIANLDVTDWSTIAGLESVKTAIRKCIIFPLMRPDLFIRLRDPPKGILLFGPPGTGKTLIGRCIASQIKATFFSITSALLTSKWVGDGEKSMKTLFQVARCLQPSVIFIDEIDSLLKSRSDTEQESSRRMKTEFLSQFDGLSKQTNEGLVVIGTTNRPHELDDAARRRFAVRLYIPLPDICARKQMIINSLKNEKHSLTDKQIDQIAERTESFSGSDMKNLCRDAAMYSISEITDRLTEISQEDIRAICFDDFHQALQCGKPSFSRDDLAKYESWNQEFGTN